MEKNRINKLSFYESVISSGFDVRSGAFAVLNSNIQMCLNEYGEFESTALSESAFEDPMLREVSAMTSSVNEDDVASELFGAVAGIKYREVIGYYSGLYAGHVVEGDFRKNASSGGLTTWILKELFEKDLIDGVVHVKKTGQGSELLFEYGISNSVEEILASSKSRYYPAEFSKVITEVKSRQGRFAFVGIPSILFELRLLCRVDPEVNKKIKYMFGLICGHQKSTKYAESIGWQFGIAPGHLTDIDFRKKVPGLPASSYSTELTGLVNGVERTVSRFQDDIFVSNWGHGMFKTKFSDFTDDALNETADVSLGDAWLPEYVHDSGGNNVLIVRNPDIQRIIEEGVFNGQVNLDQISEQTVLDSQKGLINHTRNELPYRISKYDENGLWRPRKRVTADIEEITTHKRKVQDSRARIQELSSRAYKEAVFSGNWSQFEKIMVPEVEAYSRLYRKMRLKRSWANGPFWVIRKLGSKLSHKWQKWQKKA